MAQFFFFYNFGLSFGFLVKVIGACGGENSEFLRLTILKYDYNETIGR